MEQSGWTEKGIFLKRPKQMTKYLNYDGDLKTEILTGYLSNQKLNDQSL